MARNTAPIGAQPKGKTVYAECNQKAEATKKQWQAAIKEAQDVVRRLEKIQRDASQAEFQTQVGDLQVQFQTAVRTFNQAVGSIQSLANSCFE